MIFLQPWFYVGPVVAIYKWHFNGPFKQEKDKYMWEKKVKKKGNSTMGWFSSKYDKGEISGG